MCVCVPSAAAAYEDSHHIHIVMELCTGALRQQHSPKEAAAAAATHSMPNQHRPGQHSPAQPSKHAVAEPSPWAHVFTHGMLCCPAVTQQQRHVHAAQQRMHHGGGPFFTCVTVAACPAGGELFEQLSAKGYYRERDAAHIMRTVLQVRTQRCRAQHIAARPESWLGLGHGSAQQAMESGLAEADYSIAVG